MTQLILNVLYVSLLLHVIFVGVCLWRVWRGDTVVDRLAAVDLLSTLTVAILVLIAMVNGDSIYIDIAIALAALGFVSTIALARYLANEQMF